jgi:acetamidase/formamidase
MINGPVYIEGAEPDDTLEVRILSVTPRIPYGTVSGNPGSGALPDLSPRPFTKIVHLDLKRNAGIFDENVEVPLGPFMGVMATCPADSEGPDRRSGPPGVFGGNLDCKELVAGSTLYLPVFQKGALFYTGDSHAAQGDGEITVNAIETSNTCTLQFILHKGKKLSAPRAETFTHYLAFGLDPDLDKAMRMAMIETIDFLKEKQGYDFLDIFELADEKTDEATGEYLLHIDKVETHTPESLAERNVEFQKLATEHEIGSYDGWEFGEVGGEDDEEEEEG